MSPPENTLGGCEHPDGGGDGRRIRVTERGRTPGASTNREDREARSYDFGRMTRRIPEAVATPTSTGAVAGFVRRAVEDGFQLTIRGGGHSQGGQSLTDRGLLLDMTALDRVELQGPDLVRAQGGAQWGKVVDALHGTRRLPRILTDIGEVTVGGTLSAGGMGTTSHRYGAQVGQVEQLEVVTGTGERALCSATQDKDLFDAVRSGQGQFGVITDAWIRLRPAGSRVRLYELRYRDLERFASDLESCADGDRFDHLRAEARVHECEFILYAGIEHDENLEDAKALDGLRYDEVAYTRDTARVGRGLMYPSWAFSWRHYHPWRDWFMPWDTLRTLLAQPWLDPDWVPRRPGSWTGVYPVSSREIDAPLFMRPPGERVISYSILTAIGQHHLERADRLAGKLEEVDRTLVGLGGKSYLSGGVRYGFDEWVQHYGDMFTKAVGWKREFDPHRVFRGNGLPFGADPPPNSRSA